MAELTAEDKARLRRERREARILAGGTSRLDKITNASSDGKSTFHREHQPISSTSIASLDTYDDPPDVFPDTFGAPPPLRRSSTGENPILKLLAGRQQPVSPGPESPDVDAAFQDVFQKMMSGNGADIDMNTMFAQMAQMSGQESFGGGPAGNGASATATAPGSFSDSTELWKILHYICVSVLGLYAAIVLGVRGSQIARIESTGAANSRIMWYFTTIELILQSSRFLIEKVLSI